MGKSTGTLSSVVGIGCDAEALATADPMTLESARAIRRLSHAMRTSCLRVSAASSGMASPIRISDLAK